MKIMFVTLNPSYKYDQPKKSGWNLLPSLFTQKGIKVLGIGKYDLHKFYFKYLKFNPDIIIVEWPPSCFFVPFLKKFKLIKKPIILNWGDYYTEMMTNYPKFIVRFMENYAVKNVDYITTVSKKNEKIAKKIEKKVSYIPHGYFKTTKKTSINLDKLKTNKKNLKVIYLGEQTKWKKVDQIINAVKGLDCDLFLFGIPNSEFQKIAGKNVHFMGYLPELEVRTVLKQADILVNTSNQDCNYKFFEYISVKKPILAYDGFPRNILTHKETAFLTKDFREGLIELIENKKLREKLKRNIKNIKVFSWDEITKKYIDVFEKLISQKNTI